MHRAFLAAFFSHLTDDESVVFRPPAPTTADPLDKLGLVLSDESDDESMPSAAAARSKPSPPSSNNTTAKSLSSIAEKVDKKPADTDTSATTKISAAPTARWDGILDDLFGPSDPTPPVTVDVKKEKKDKTAKAAKTSTASSVSSSASHKEKTAKIVDKTDLNVPSTSKSSTVDDQAGVQSPDSGFVEGSSLDGAAEDTKGGGKQPTTPAKSKKKLKRVESIMGSIGRVSPLLSPIREFPPLTYLSPPHSRPSLKCRIDLSGLDDCDRLDLLDQQPSTSSSTVADLIDDLPLTERVQNEAAARKLSRPDEQKSVKRNDAVEAKKKRPAVDEADSMPTLSKEVPFRAVKEEAVKVEKAPLRRPKQEYSPPPLPPPPSQVEVQPPPPPPPPSASPAAAKTTESEVVEKRNLVRHSTGFARLHRHGI